MTYPLSSCFSFYNSANGFQIHTTTGMEKPQLKIVVEAISILLVAVGGRGGGGGGGNLKKVFKGNGYET